MNSIDDDLLSIQGIAREQGKDIVRLEVARWLNQHLDAVEFNAQAELLRILGVKIL